MKNFMLEMEQAGFISHREKLEHLGLDYEISERTQAPILEACPVVLDCQVDRIIEEDGICHIFAKILERLADPELLDDKGHFKNDRLCTDLLYGGRPSARLSLSGRPSRPHGKLYEESEEEE